MSKIAHPDRRLVPRPLPAHLASAMLLWLSSRAALPILRHASPRRNSPDEQLHALAEEIGALGHDSVAAALDNEILDRAEAYLAGLEAYRRHPFRRFDGGLPVLWRDGSTRLLDFGPESKGPVVLVVPSLINRYYILDLLPERSFVRHLVGQGLRPVVVDWGEPGSDELDFGLRDYVVARLEAAFGAAFEIAGAPIGILGYCMGGLLALALALRRQAELACVALLATPWDFYADRAVQARGVAHAAERLLLACDKQRGVPVDIIQSLFLMLDPFSAQRKFTRFAALDPRSDGARRFVALEDWLNDGVPLALGVARECANCWYGENEPARGHWRIDAQCIEPRLLRRPALVVVPSQDRIVPPNSAEPLAARLHSATVLRPPLGHVGMMSAARAPKMLWTPIAEWLRAQLGNQ